jgi:hypothetical protein
VGPVVSKGHGEFLMIGSSGIGEKGYSKEYHIGPVLQEDFYESKDMLANEKSYLTPRKRHYGTMPNSVNTPRACHA